MKKIFILSALMSIIILTACNKQEIGDDFVPIDHESTTLPTNNKADNYDVAGNADFTINNEDNIVFEKDALLLTNNSTNAVSYHWDFGNGDTSLQALPSYKYEIHGNYTITLTITDENGETYQISDEILVLCLFGGGVHNQ